MALIIELPHVGESVVEGTIGKWLKQPGDAVQRFEPLVEVVTDKVTTEVPSPVEGSLLRVLAQEGETVPMGAPIAEMDTAEATQSDGHAPKTSAEAAPTSTTGYLVTEARPVGPTGGGPSEEEPPDPRKSSDRVPSGVARPSPAVRRLAEEHGVDLSEVHGTGLGGRISRDDLFRHIQEAPATAAPAPQVQPKPEPAPSDEEEHVPLTPVRRMIAEAMVRSVSQIPHAWSSLEVDVDSLVDLRNQVRRGSEEQEGIELTYLPFVIKAVVESLKEHPTFNATWGGDKIILKKRINLGIAVAAPHGLIVPVIHDADRLSIAELARTTRDLVQRSRQNKLTLDDVHGGTFTLNNTGALGSMVSQPIIDHPQAAILTTEAIQKRPVVREDTITIRWMMNLCLSFDHRINDGAESGAFLQAVKASLESIGPDTPIF